MWFLLKRIFLKATQSLEIKSEALLVLQSDPTYMQLLIMMSYKNCQMPIKA